MAQTILQLLASIYGPEAAVEMDAQIQALLAEHAPAGAAWAETGRRSRYQNLTLNVKCWDLALLDH